MLSPIEKKVSYHCLTEKGVRAKKMGDRMLLDVRPEALTRLASEAFADVAFFLRTTQLKDLAAILTDNQASDNDRFVAESLLKNAIISSEGLLPLCQDTGTATIVGWRGMGVLTDGNDEEALSRGVFETYTKRNLRYSQMAPLTLFDEVNTECNLPAQIELYADKGADYRFLFIAKGGGSSNKTSLFQETKALLNEAFLEKFIREKIKVLGVAACPPYHIAIVVGGTSPEMNLKTVKYATAGMLDNLPTKGNRLGIAFRDKVWEARALKMAQESGLGAQFGGRNLAFDVRVIRLPRHAGSCPVSIAVSCNADRNILGKITADGVFLEELDKAPARFLPKSGLSFSRQPIAIDLTKPMSEILVSLKGKPVGTLVSLNGPLIVARDIAHARLKTLLDKTGTLPNYFKDHPIYYAGPAKTPEGYASGSFGPTTAQRMDGYLSDFMKQGASRVTLAKGNRNPVVAEVCKNFGGFYLGTIGGAASLMAKEHIVSSEVIDFKELGMEAVRKIVVRNLPAFILGDDGGKTLY
ncbi:MAG: fumarate hydratase [Elusimicrobia bacterium RIFOXYB2_FULL_49_7]|nr:MAG: fumarate hydratase [Elusimicrobia bacterium RIFOXYB2_FULL_49_7]